MSFVEKLRQKFSYVHVAEEKKIFVDEILRTLIDGGRKKIHVVVDFDFTLTQYEKDGKDLPSTYAVIESYQHVKLADGTLVKDETDRLRHIYHPIEYDPKMTIEEKKPLMVEWWCAAQSLLAASNLNRSLIHEAVEKSPMELRVGARNFIADSLKNQIPVLIFSAGLGDVIKSFLEKSLPEFEKTPELAHLISNFMIFDDKDNLVAFNKTVIHSFNKSEQILNDPEYRKSIVDRPNVILLGDTIGDVGMIDGIENSTHSLKIGFLNRASIDKLEVYQRAYDIVISDNETFDVPNEILRSVIDR